MKKQVIIIHGATSFKTHEDYISYLKNEEVSIEVLKSHKSWRDTLTSELGDDYEVLIPRMPNKQNARYEEWKIWFERIDNLLDDEVILIGHSMGGTFLVKYLSENIFSKKIKSVVLVAAPFDEEDDVKNGDSTADFIPPSSLIKLIEQARKIYILYSKDDPVVAFRQLERYQQALPDAKVIVFEDRQHFGQETFPEIIELIKSI